MSGADYETWVGQHCEATGATVEAGVSLLAPASRRAFAEWDATTGELGECTYRLIRGRRVPKFASDHAEAVARELLQYRAEVAADRRNDTATADPIGSAIAIGPRCRWCRDSGLVTVPLWCCVEVPHHAPPRLVPHPGYRAVLTGSVLCDAPECAPGRAARDVAGRANKPRPGLRKYLSRFGGVNVVELLERHDREVVEHARRTAPRGPCPFAEVFARMRARVENARTGDE